MQSSTGIALVPGAPTPAQAVSAFNVSPSVDWSTFIGADLSSDQGRGAAYDSEGRPITCGLTESAQFPTLVGPFLNPPGGVEDGFLTKLTADGSQLVFSTYLGGSKKDYAVAVDTASNDELAVLAVTTSSDWPVTPGAYDTTTNAIGGNYAMTVSRLTADGSTPIFSTYYGSDTSDFFPRFSTIAKDDGTVLVCGGSGGVPLTPESAFGLTDYGAFLAKLSNDGSELLFSTSPPCEAFMAELSDGAIVVGGLSLSSTFDSTGGFQPTWGGGQFDAWLGVVSADGRDLLTSTFLGGTEIDGGRGLDVDAFDNIYFSGTTQSPDFPDPNTPFSGTPFPDAPGYIARFDRSLTQPDWIALIGVDNPVATYQTSWSALASDNSGVTTVMGWAQAAFVDNATVGAHIVENPDLWTGRVLRIAPDGQRVLYASALDLLEPAPVAGIRVPAKGRNSRVLLLNGTTGTTLGQMPPTPGAFKDDCGPECGREAFLTQFNFLHEGVEALGSGGASCLGRIALNTTRRADVGASDFALYVSQAPPDSVGVLLLGGPLALPLPVEGQTLWIDAATLLPLQVLATGETGYGILDLGIPPAAAGKTFAAQAAMLGTPACDSAGQLVLSEALTVSVP